jgi:hypothetical protein
MNNGRMNRTDPTMNIKRLLLAIFAGFVFVFISDFLIHGVWLRADYMASMSLWRPEAEMQSHMPWMMTGQFLAAATFVTLWAMGCAARGSVGGACLYGLLMGIFHQANTLITYSVTPLPPDLATKWFASGLLQAVLFGMLTFFVYKPAPRTGAA